MAHLYQFIFSLRLRLLIYLYLILHSISLQVKDPTAILTKLMFVDVISHTFSSQQPPLAHQQQCKL